MSKFKSLLYTIAGALALMSPAFYNGYPLVYADTGAYIQSGFELSVPESRPIIYGLFIYLSSLGISLWFTLFFQCLILSCIISIAVKLVLADDNSNVLSFLITAFLSATTGIAWYSAQLMPDIFTGIAVLSLFCLLYWDRMSRLERIISSLIFMLSSGVHFSNMILIAGMLVIVMLIFRRKYAAYISFLPLKSVSIFSGLLITIGLIALLNFSISGSAKVGRGGHVFFMGRLLDSGLLKTFLDENCVNSNYVLCNYKDSMPKDSRDFLWSPASPVYKLGGWGKTEDDFNKIIKDFLKHPHYLVKLTILNVSDCITQLFQNNIGTGLISEWYADPASPPYEQIAKRFPDELNQYKNARQNTNIWGQGLNLVMPNKIDYVALLLSVLVIMYFIFLKSNRAQLPGKTKVFILITLSSLLINALVAATFANVYDRLQSRMTWLIPFAVILILFCVKGYKGSKAE